MGNAGPEDVMDAAPPGGARTARAATGCQGLHAAGIPGAPRLS